MGSICSSPDENQLDRSPQEAPLVVWGDVTNSESRVVMTLLNLAKVRFEFQQVTTPVESANEGDGKNSDKLNKEDYLEVPEDPSNLARSKRVSGRSIYVGDRDAFFKFLSLNYSDIEAQLVPQEQSKRFNQCLDWHKGVLQPAVKRLVEAKRRLQWQQARRKTANQSNSMLFQLTNEQLSDCEKAYALCVSELKKYILPAIEDQLLIRKFFCSAQKGSRGYSLADVVIYHELYTALAYSQVVIDSSVLPNTTEWITALTQEAAFTSQNNKLQEYISQQRYNYFTQQSQSQVQLTQDTSTTTTQSSPQLRNSGRASLRLTNSDSDED